MAIIHILRAGRWVTTRVPVDFWQETLCSVLEDPQVREYRVEDESGNLIEHARVAPTARYYLKRAS